MKSRIFFFILFFFLPLMTFQKFQRFQKISLRYFRITVRDKWCPIFKSQTRQDSNQHMFQNVSLFRPSDLNSLFFSDIMILTFYHCLNFIHFFLYSTKWPKLDTIFHLKHLLNTSGCVKNVMFIYTTKHAVSGFVAAWHY